MSQFKIKFVNHWIFGPIFDLTFILSPAFVSVLIVLFLNSDLERIKEIPTWTWVLLILSIDVSHVYSTLFRTYFHEREWEENRSLFTLVPIFCFILGVIIHSFNSMLFWSGLAYLAVFHFIRQQYGFVRIYTRQENESPFSQVVEAATVYLSMLYPLIYWHSHLPRNFQWFMQGDFFSGLPVVFSEIFFYVYLSTLLIYILKEIHVVLVHHTFNVSKNLFLLGTGLSWYIGIVFTNNDGSFTITNVISHGVPYLALIWAYGFKTSQEKSNLAVMGKIPYRLFFSLSTLPIFLLVLFIFGYLEEGFWAGFVWREHLEVFPFFDQLPEMEQRNTLNLLVPLLSLPQITHYVLDGFIWKMRNQTAYWNRLFFHR